MNQFRKDIELMINTRPNWYWRICWVLITPGITAALIIFSMVKHKKLELDKYVYPEWAESISNLTAAFPIVCIPAWFLFKYCREGGWIVSLHFSFGIIGNWIVYKNKQLQSFNRNSSRLFHKLYAISRDWKSTKHFTQDTFFVMQCFLNVYNYLFRLYS